MATIHIVEILGTTPDGNLKYDLSADEHLTADQIATLAQAAEERGSYAVIDVDTDGNEYASFFGDYAACQADIENGRKLVGVERRTVLVLRWTMGNQR